MRNALNRVFAGLTVVYLTLVALLAALAVLLGEAGDIAAGVLALLLFPALILFPLSLLLRHLRLALLTAVPLLALVVFYSPLFIPRSATAPVNTRTFDIISFNVQMAAQNLDELGAILREADADIVGLQELSPPNADYFQSSLQDLYPHQALYPRGDYAGQGILSRYPIAADDYWRNHDLPVTYGHLQVEVDVDGTTIVVFNAHPVPAFSFEHGLQASTHREEVTRILERTSDVTEPLILLGDFNMTPQYDEYQQVTARYTDSFPEVGDTGFGFTFPGGGSSLPLPPVARLDYIFYDDSFTGLEARVWPRSGPSDHRPVWARLALNTGAS